MSVDVVFLASEFPNDNPALHAGVIWVCLEPTAMATAELVPRPGPRCETEIERAPPTILSEVEDDEMIVVEELAPLDDHAFECIAIVPAFESVAPPSIDPTESSPPPPSDDPFTTLVCTLADVAIGAGSPQIGALLPGLFFDGRLPDALDPGTEATLRAAGIWNGSEVAPAFVATVRAWQAILRGTSDDFSACDGMLDEWTSALLATLLDGTTSAPRLRQELRTRGVAAFGLSSLLA